MFDLLILNMSVTKSDSPFGGGDDDEDGEGIIDSSFLWTWITSSNTADLAYFSYLIPYSAVANKDLINNPNIILSNLTCWDSYDEVGTAGFYNSSLTYGVSPLSYDMSSRSRLSDFGASDDSNDLCDTYTGTYFIVIKASSATTVNVEATIKKQAMCGGTGAATTAALWLILLALGIIVPSICYAGKYYYDKKYRNKDDDADTTKLTETKDIENLEMKKTDTPVVMPTVIGTSS